MKTMKQPRKDVLREQLALAAEEIITLRAALAAAEAVRKSLAPAPWWRRLLGAFR